ncbi:DNA cytosine methyltransferase [Xanthomonas nasturtii]|uniref:DNA cytosine methyltransferase n=1 Tax=Xanthomonas nasturtii TaxID=1843581 RepID=UPI0020133C52|nr:DNA cytosine methyltransferase [Xanthomonas nasturtii]MCL1528723.1 DNA cytosine methyltransferase [Xanthomonas nasturtii]MCL1542609.1 DNA cytosine methyltransferase [Xanthomonas nasturtii]
MAKATQLRNCISLFSGCGGMDLGIEAAGFKVRVATDAEPLCGKTYEKNFPGVPFIVRKIGELSTSELLETAGLKVGEVDLLIGGPPCPAFSKSRFYRTEKPRALDDPVAKETVGGYLRVLKEVKPRAFLLENVKGLAYGVHKEALDYILESAKKLGYKTSVNIINAADYGVPQIRERCLVMGFKGDAPMTPGPTHSKSPSDSLLPWVTAGQVLGDLDTEEMASFEGHFAGGKHHDLLCEIPPGENYLFFTEEKGHHSPRFKWRSRYWSFLLKLSRDLPSWTIQARRSNNMGPFHWRSRILRIEEIKRLQTFPDSFDLEGTIERQWRQIGNAVPPLVAEHFGRVLFNCLSVAQDENLIYSKKIGRD